MQVSTHLRPSSSASDRPKTSHPLRVDQRDPTVDVEREQDDLGRVEIALRSIALFTYRRLGAHAVRDVGPELRVPVTRPAPSRR
ncbi:MAG: hypothetical protein JWM82_3979 [Myxococcales bacterium]|nr:hypothetical protein [Myxococcales bacterium]